jgi:hypothetical protein
MYKRLISMHIDRPNVAEVRDSFLLFVAQHKEQLSQGHPLSDNDLQYVVNILFYDKESFVEFVEWAAEFDNIEFTVSSKRNYMYWHN